MSGMNLWCPITKEKRLLCAFMFILTKKWTVIPKWHKKKFFLWYQCINSFIPMSRMNLWGLIIKRKEIIMWICAYPNWKTRFISKKWWKLKFFLRNQSINSFIPMRRMSLWCQLWKKKEIIMWNCVYLNLKVNFNSKKVKREVFLKK